MLSIPAIAAELAKGKGPKWSHAQKMAMAKGIVAHLAIQTAYRVQHPGNLVICERMVSIGLRRLLSMGRFGELAKRGAKLLADAAKASKVLRRLAPGQEDLVSAIVHLLDVATNEGTAAGSSLKRYDIIDFGPLAAGSFGFSLAQAYEIKPWSEVAEGKAYIARQVDAFRQTVTALGATLASALGVPGLEMLTVNPGTQWPPFPYVVPLGVNVLIFGRVAPGLIVYEWLRFKPQSLKKVWELYRQVQTEVLEHVKPRIDLPSLSEIAAGAATVGAAIALVGAALLAAEAAPIVVIGEALSGGALLARVAPLFRAVLAGSGFLASPALASAPASSLSKENFRGPEAIEAGYQALLGNGPFKPATTEVLPGGTAEAPDPAWILADAMTGEMLHRILVKVGQGNELYDEHGVEAVRVALRVWLRGYIHQFGMKEFLAMFGEGELSVEVGCRIASSLMTLGEQFTLGTEVAVMITELLSMTEEEFDLSLPENCGDDGEAPR